MIAYSYRIFLEGVAVSTTLCLYLAYVSYRKYGRRLPPGPRPLPILGNLLDFPKKSSWLQYQKWAAQYGDVISLTAFGQVVIVLNSNAVVKDIALGTHSSVFSGRPSMKFFEMAGWLDVNLALMPVGKKWRDRRRIIDNHFRPTNLQVYQSIQQEKAATAVKRLFEDPSQFVKHTREYAGATILSIVYGYDVQEKDDPFVNVAEQVNVIFMRAQVPGEFIVNTLPFLARLPLRLLGSGFARLVRETRHAFITMLAAPWEWAKDALTKGVAKECLARDALIDLQEGGGVPEIVLRDAFGVIYGAASDTSVAALSSFFLAMILYPDSQARARTEIDSVVGRARLPALVDRPRLPYMEALLMEVLRWNPVTPLGLPHVSNEDVFWREYCIPKGATIFGNTWAILHDPKTYPNPGTFYPERFLTPDGQVIEDPLLEYAFGFGARRCPGRHLAEATLWIFMATVISQCQISKVDGAGHLSASADYAGPTLVNHPHPFDCDIRPRDELARSAIEAL